MEIHFEIGYISEATYEVRMPLVHGGSVKVTSGTLIECCDWIKSLDNPESYSSVEPKPADPELERLLAEEEEIERRFRRYDDNPEPYMEDN